MPDKTSLSLRLHPLKPYLGLLFVLVLAGGLYLPMVFEWFQTDDFLFLNTFHHSNSAGYVKDAFDFRHAPPFPEQRFYRPLHSSSFLVLYHVLGLHAAGYHLWSLAVHLLNTSLLWLISVRLTKRQLVATLAAALFALHPAYAPAVAWISNNNALMATAASLISFWCFLKSEESDRPCYWYWASVGGYAASLLFHPEAGPMIVVLFAYRLLFSRQDQRGARRWRRWVDLIPFVLIAFLYLAIHRWMVSQDFLPQAQGFQITHHMIRVYLGYLALCLYPISPAQLALTSPGPDAAAAAMVAVLGLLLYLGLARGRRAATLAVTWLLATLIPLSTAAVPLSNDVFGRKLYVAGPALALALALLLAPTIEVLGRSAGKAGQAALVAACVSILSVAGWRIFLYENDVAMSARQSHNLMVELQRTYPKLPPRTRLYVLDAPLLTFSFFLPIYPQNMIGLYYDDVDVIPTNEQELPPLQPGDIVFRYRPSNAGTP